MDRSFPIHIHDTDIDSIRQTAVADINFAAGDFDESCADGWHSVDCQFRMDHSSDACIQIRLAEQARVRLKKLNSLHVLKRCMQDPTAANGERTFEGMAMKSCIFDTE